MRWAPDLAPTVVSRTAGVKATVERRPRLRRTSVGSIRREMFINVQRPARVRAGGVMRRLASVGGAVGSTSGIGTGASLPGLSALDSRGELFAGGAEARLHQGGSELGVARAQGGDDRGVAALAVGERLAGEQPEVHPSQPRHQEVDRDDQVRVVGGVEDDAVEAIVGVDAVLDAARGQRGDVGGVVGGQELVVGLGQTVGSTPGGRAVQLGGGGEGLARELEVEGGAARGSSASRSRQR